MPKKLECPKCDRKFSMPAHLARHLATHGATAIKKSPKKSKRGPGRPKGSGNKRKQNAAAHVVAGINLSAMHVQELSDLIDAARDEARRKLRELDIKLALPGDKRRR